MCTYLKDAVEPLPLAAAVVKVRSVVPSLALSADTFI